MLQEAVQPKWIVVPSMYEKWRHPGSKQKHYRAIFRASTGQRRYSKTKFKTASAALEFAVKFNLHLCGKKRREADAIRGQGDLPS